MPSSASLPALRRAVLLAALAAGLGPPGRAVAQGLRTVPSDRWSYRVADALLLRNPDLGSEIWYGFRPWREAEFDSLATVAGARRAPGSGLESAWLEMLADGHRAGAAADPADTSSVTYHNTVWATGRGDLRQDQASFEPAFLPATFDDDLGEPDVRAMLGHDFAVQVRDRFLLGWRYVVDSNIRNDPTRRTRLGIRGTEAAFEVLDAYVSARAGPVRATVGRQALSLGPGRGASPLLSDSIPGLDQVRLELHADPVRFTALVATLSRERPNRLIDDAGNTIPGTLPAEDQVPFDVTRFLYLHRVDWRVTDRLQLAITEAAVVTGIDRGLELRFANPLIPFFVTQEDGDETDSENVNVVADVEGVYTGLGKSRLYGNLFVQEFFIDAEKRDRIGNQLAWRLGAEWGDPLGWTGGSVGAEYTRADVFAYLHRGLNTNWATFGVPLGSMIGPDADQLLAWAEWWLAPATVVGVDLLARRNGERSIETLESVLVAGNPDFPSGVVQREWRAGAELRTLLRRWDLEATARVSRRMVDNIGNERRRDGDFWEASLALTYRLRLQ